MGTTALLIGAIVMVWVLVLLPMYLRRNQHGLAESGADTVDPTTQFSSTMRVVRRGTAALVDQDLHRIDGMQISTPLTRRAAISEIRRSEQRAARRRRNSLAVLGLSFLSVGALSAAGVTPWWALAIPGVLIVAFLVIARFSVVRMHEHFDRQLARIAEGNDEDTVTISREELDAVVGVRHRAGTESVEMGAPGEATGTLWDPLPVTRPTYVQTPVAPRTVRTIDLSAPVIAQDRPVTADGPDEHVPAEESIPLEGVVITERPRAVGE